MKSKTLSDLFLHQLKDVLYAEKHIGKMLSKLIKAAGSGDLKQALENHRDGTHTHVERLETMFGLMDKKVHSVPCEAVNGLIEETKDMLEEFEDSETIDAGVIAAAQAMAHYAIARYTSLKLWATQLGLGEVAALLDTTLGEEKQAHARLTDLAGDLSVHPPNDPSTPPLTLKMAALSGLK